MDEDRNHHDATNPNLDYFTHRARHIEALLDDDGTDSVSLPRTRDEDALPMARAELIQEEEQDERGQKGGEEFPRAQVVMPPTLVPIFINIPAEAASLPSEEAVATSDTDDEELSSLDNDDIIDELPLTSITLPLDGIQVNPKEAEAATNDGYTFTDADGKRGTYRGFLMEGTLLPHGFGRLDYYDSQQWYEGWFDQGQQAGYGKLCNASGDQYIGSFQNGEKHGIGKVKYADGSVFEGTFANGEMVHGQRTYNDGSIYTGSWSYGMRHGKGKLEFEDGTAYEGDFANNLFSGQGKSTRLDGSVHYDGEWYRGYPVLRAPPIHNYRATQGTKVVLNTFAERVRSSVKSAVKHFDTSNRETTCQMPFSDVARRLKVQAQTVSEDSTDYRQVNHASCTDTYGEQGVYTGHIMSSTGKPHGLGRITYRRPGRWYDGEWVNGRWTGFGYLSDGYGHTYQGYFKDGHKNGLAVMKFADGRIFSGEYSKGQMKHGAMTYTNRSTYSGSWEDGMYHGTGKLTGCQGGWYEGEWWRGLRHGRGKEVMADGSVIHDGEWREDEPFDPEQPDQYIKNLPSLSSIASSVPSESIEPDLFEASSKLCRDRQGKLGFYTGSMSTETGMPHRNGHMKYEQVDCYYEGDWVHGRWTGRGKHSNGFGDVYEGDFERDRKHGRGVLKYADGRIFDGWYDKGQMVDGKMTYIDGSTFSGSWKAGMYHGEGKFEFANGSAYEGGFRDGEFSGKGRMVWKDGAVLEGDWQNGEVKEDDEGAPRRNTKKRNRKIARRESRLALSKG